MIEPEPGIKLNKIKRLFLKIFRANKSSNSEIDHIDLGNSLEYIPGLSGSKNLFLGRFNEKDIFLMLEKIGLIKYLNSIGFRELLLDIDKDQSQIYYCRLFWREKKQETLLIDLRVSESTFMPDKRYLDSSDNMIPYDMIVIEWLSAKNPLKKFDGNRPQLPGQSNPGLGVMSYCFDFLHIIAKQVYKDGFLDIPDHMHGAIMYSGKFKFFDPVHEGIIRAVIRDLSDYPLADISWGVITNTIIERYKNQPAIYAPGEQICSVSRRMKKYFESKKYKTTFKKYYNRKRYYLDYEEMKKRRENILKLKKIEDI